MGFPKQEARRFTRENVLAITPGQHGVYGLFRDGGPWVYVGKGDIRTRLLAHLNGDNACITQQKPTHWVDWVTDNADAIEEALILELKPVCNKRVG